MAKKFIYCTTESVDVFTKKFPKLFKIIIVLIKT